MARRILVCDDEADIRETLALLLRDEGYDVGVVSNGAAAVAEAAEADALLLDIKMPGQDGLETLAEIRKKNLAVPVVMISGHADIRTAMEAIRAGAKQARREVEDFEWAPQGFDFPSSSAYPAHLKAAWVRAV